jgi:hypothetical protein
MNTITKGDFLQMVKLNHLEVLTQEQLSRNTQILKTYMEKALVSDLSDVEKGEANVIIDEVGSFQQWCVLRDDFSKAIVYTRPEQIAWDEPERGEFGELLKARGGVYKPTGENKKLGRVGQKYGEGKSKDPYHEEKVREAGMTRKWPEGIDKDGFLQKKEGSKKKLVPVTDDRNKVTKMGNVEIHEVNKESGLSTEKEQGKDYMPDQDMTRDEIEREQKARGGKKLSTAEVDKLHKLCNYSKKPFVIEDIEQTKITDEIRSLVDRLPVIEQKDNFFQGNIPKESKGEPYIAEVKGSRFLCDPQGYDYPRYITQLVKKVTPVE